jgi:hypothetical protein
MELLLARPAGGAEHIHDAHGSILMERREPHHAFHAGHHRCAVVAETIQRAGHDQAFEHTLADDLWIDPLAEIFKIDKRLLGPLCHNVLYSGVADALDRRQRIENLVLADLEVGRTSSPTAR